MEDVAYLLVANAFLMEELGSFKATMKMVCADLWMEDSLVCKVLCCAGEIACKGRQAFHLGHDGGYMIPVHSKFGQEMRIHFERLVSWYRSTQLISLSASRTTFSNST